MGLYRAAASDREHPDSGTNARIAPSRIKRENRAAPDYHNRPLAPADPAAVISQIVRAFALFRSL